MTWGAIYSNMLAAIHSQTDALARLQEQVSSGERIIRPSDDPVDASSVIRLKSQSRSMDTYLKNVGTVTMVLDDGSAVLQKIADSLSRVKQIVTQAASQTYSAANRRAIGEEINQLLEGMVSSVNSESIGRYIFSGTANTVAPYLVERSGSRITSVTYQGAGDPLEVTVAPDMRQFASLVGGDVFRSDDRQRPVYLGNTGVKDGDGASSARGDVWLSVTHDETTYGGATGVAAGASSADGDTILGDGHTLTIDPVAKTVSLDSGPPVSYTVAGTDLKVSNNSGDVVYLDMSGLDPGLVDVTNVTIHSSGKLSIDGGDTTTDTDFSENQMVADSAGRVLCVDTTGLTRTGIEPIRIRGTYDLFETLINVRDLLTGNRNVPEGQLPQLLNQAIESVDEITSNMLAQMTSVGARVQEMDRLQETITNIKANSDARVSQTQDADIAQLAAELARVQAFYQIILLSSSKMMNLSLMDYLD